MWERIVVILRKEFRQALREPRMRFLLFLPPLVQLIVFGYAVKEFWQFRERWTFWGELGVLIVAHFTILQRLHWEQASYFWLMVVVGIPEMIVAIAEDVLRRDREETA